MTRRTGVGVLVVANVAGLGAVIEAVVVAVDVEHVDQVIAIGVVAWVGLVAIEDAVVIGVGVVQIRAEETLEFVAQAVVVAVLAACVILLVVGIDVAGVHFAVEVGVLRAVGDAAVIGVRVERIGHGGRVHVGAAVMLTGIGRRMAAVETQFSTVVEPVVVAVRIERVDQAVSVTILVPTLLVTVDDAVVVAAIWRDRVGLRARCEWTVATSA